MLHITIHVEGMQCPMCESHVVEGIQEKFPVKSVVASHKKKSVEIETEESIDPQEIAKVIEEIGYSAGKAEIADSSEKKGLFSLFRK